MWFSYQVQMYFFSRSLIPIQSHFYCNMVQWAGGIDGRANVTEGFCRGNWSCVPASPSTSHHPCTPHKGIYYFPGSSSRTHYNCNGTNSIGFKWTTTVQCFPCRLWTALPRLITDNSKLAVGSRIPAFTYSILRKLKEQDKEWANYKQFTGSWCVSWLVPISLYIPKPEYSELGAGFVIAHMYLLCSYRKLSQKTNDFSRFKELMLSRKNGSQSDIVSYSDLIERLQKSSGRMLDLNAKLEQAKIMASILM